MVAFYSSVHDQSADDSDPWCGEVREVEDERAAPHIQGFQLAVLQGSKIQWFLSCIKMFPVLNLIVKRAK